jgi:hypothetical protein
MVISLFNEFELMASINVVVTFSDTDILELAVMTAEVDALRRKLLNGSLEALLE